ncbi:hypothetical protein [Gemmatimonas sp.]|jgi:hypothetical protein|uniref:hypothetical protein n=1 Tax=Gemmatimonas sp. TaxID=1962908 RepID=UPI0037BFFAB9
MIKSRLLSVAHTSAEISAGIPGRCAVSVRVLDNVTLRIHAGELVLVHAPESLAQAMLLAALAGREHSPRHRYVRSLRDSAPGLRIRRAALHVLAVPDIMFGWHEARVDATAPASRTLYLLRASRDGAITRRDAAEWRRWGRQAHERLDGIVIACPPVASRPGDDPRQPAGSSAHEPRASYVLDDPWPRSSTMRTLELRAGRLHIVRTPRRYRANAERLTVAPAPHPWCSAGSGDAHAPTAFRPWPRASTES